jgi:hypothetical protein
MMRLNTVYRQREREKSGDDVFYYVAVDVG